jgi:hypothetical protein
MDQAIFSDRQKCNGDSAYLDIRAKGDFQSKHRWGITVVGTIVPWSTEEVVSYFDAETHLDLQLEVSANGKIKADGNTIAPLFRSQLSRNTFNHPGLVQLTPWANIGVSVKADIELAGNFTIPYVSYLDRGISQTYPSRLLKAEGNASISAVFPQFRGFINGARQGGMQISMIPESGFEILINNYGTQGHILGANITGFVPTYGAVEVDGKNSYTVTIGSEAAEKALTYAKGGTDRFSQWDPDSTTTTPLGSRPGAKQIAAGAPGDDKKPPGRPPNAHAIEWDDLAALAALKMLSCPTNLKKKRRCDIMMCSRTDLFNCDFGDKPCVGRLSKMVKRVPLLESAINSQEIGNFTRVFAPLAGQRTALVYNSRTGRTVTIRYDDADYPSCGDWANYG